MWPICLENAGLKLNVILCPKIIHRFLNADVSTRGLNHLQHFLNALDHTTPF